MITKRPKTWCIQVTEENCKLVREWRLEQCSDDYSVDIGYWVLSKHLADGTYYYSSDVLGKEYSDYTRITFEEFKEYILKEPILPIIEDLSYMVEFLNKLDIK